MDVTWHLFWKWLPDDELADAIKSDDARDRIIGGFVQPYRREVQFLRGDMVSLVTVPFDWFTPSGDGTSPDFGRLSIEDYGATIALGEYEVSERSILRDFDPEYNRRCLEQEEAARRFRDEILPQIRTTASLPDASWD